MSKIVLALFVLFCSTNSLYAGNTEPSYTAHLALIVAIVALLVGVFNILWMLRIRLVHRVDLINQKEDMNLTIEGVKTDLTREIRNNRKELQKMQRVNHPDKETLQTKQVQPARELKNRPVQSTTEPEVKDEQLNQSKPKKKYYRRYKPSNKSGEQQKGNPDEK